MEIDPFLYYFVITETLNLSNMKYKLTYLNQYLLKKNKGSLWPGYQYSTIWEEIIVIIIHNYGAKAILYSFVIIKTPNMSSVK